MGRPTSAVRGGLDFESVTEKILELIFDDKKSELENYLTSLANNTRMTAPVAEHFVATVLKEW